MRQRVARVARQFGEQVGGEDGDVAVAFAQGRHGEADDVQAVVEVFAEFVFGDAAGEVVVGGGDDAHVHRFFAVAADGAHGALLDGAQQFDLHGQRQVGDFVKEQGAAVRGDKEAVLVLVGAGERAFFVAEEFAFDEVFRDGAAVHRDKGALTAVALVVDGARGDFFPRPGFAVDEDGRLRARDFADHRPHFLHDFGIADEFVFVAGATAAGSGTGFFAAAGGGRVARAAAAFFERGFADGA